jgi:hypothetical protein
MARLAFPLPPGPRSLPRRRAPRPPAPVPAVAEAMLREMAFVLHATRAVRGAMAAGNGPARRD